MSGHVIAKAYPAVVMCPGCGEPMESFGDYCVCMDMIGGCKLKGVRYRLPPHSVTLIPFSELNPRVEIQADNDEGRESGDSAGDEE